MTDWATGSSNANTLVVTQSGWASSDHAARKQSLRLSALSRTQWT